jgi:hypothetical protein
LAAAFTTWLEAGVTQIPLMLQDTGRLWANMGVQHAAR